jgi:hypothetical protein
MRFLHRGLLLLAALSVLSAVASAGPLLWTFSGATFADGATLTGSFDYDADSGAFSSVNVTISGSTNSAFNVTMTVDDPGIYSNSTTLEFSTILPAVVDETPSLYIALSTAMTDAGGTIPIGDEEGYDGICSDTTCSSYSSANDYISGGSITAVSTVPELATISLVGSALLGLGVFARKRSQRS